QPARSRRCQSVWVRRAYLQLVDAKERFRVAGEAVTMAEETLREAEARYRGQNVIITQFIDAQVSLSNAPVRYANVAADVEVARAALERATGRFANFVAQRGIVYQLRRARSER